MSETITQAAKAAVVQLQAETDELMRACDESAAWPVKCRVSRRFVQGALRSAFNDLREARRALKSMSE